jgi:hypothetical protein
MKTKSCSSSKKMMSGGTTKMMSGGGLDKWRKHLDSCRKQNPSKSLKECMTMAKKTYKK